MAFSPTSKSYLILVNFGLLQFCLTLLLESDNDQGNENVDEEEREDNEENNVEDSLLSPVPRYWTHVLIG